MRTSLKLTPLWLLTFGCAAGDTASAVADAGVEAAGGVNYALGGSLGPAGGAPLGGTDTANGPPSAAPPTGGMIWPEGGTQSGAGGGIKPPEGGTAQAAGGQPGSAGGEPGPAAGGSAVPPPPPPPGGDCAVDCPENYVGDGVCDDACNTAPCTFDGGDCDAGGENGGGLGFGGAGGDPGFGGDFGFGGDPGFGDECAPGCPADWPGDGVCDAECDVDACGFDGGDCGF